MRLTEWSDGGNYINVLGRRVFYRFQSGNRCPILYLHGYPSASIDLAPCIPFLQDFGWVAHDHPGYGLSEKPVDYSYSLIEQADTTLQLWKQIGIKEGHLVAHDYGTSVATEILSQRLRGFEPLKIKSLTLCNGSMHIELAQLKLIQRAMKNHTLGPIVAKFSNSFIFRQNMTSLWGDKTLIQPGVLDDLWELLQRDGGRRALPFISRYVDERYKFWHRWIGALKQLNIPCLVLWGRKDPVAVDKIAITLAGEIPNAKLIWMEKEGHYPMLENPELWSSNLMSFLKGFD